MYEILEGALYTRSGPWDDEFQMILNFFGLWIPLL